MVRTQPHTHTANHGTIHQHEACCQSGSRSRLELARQAALGRVEDLVRPEDEDELGAVADAHRLLLDRFDRIGQRRLVLEVVQPDRALTAAGEVPRGAPRRAGERIVPGDPR
jgi:hypothetical protein